MANIIPICKKEDKPDCSDYRSISLLSSVRKIVAQCLRGRLYKFLNKTNCLYANQFGFKNIHSTNHALIIITEKIRRALDNDEFVCGVFQDFRKAFDTVNHNIMLTKMEYQGIRGLASDWFKSYLANRLQQRSIQETTSSQLKITYGLPQCSVLGPLLFLVYMNDLNQAIVHSIIHHFADDANMLYSNKSLQKINQYITHKLSLIVQWLRTNRISLNQAKTEIIIF